MLAPIESDNRRVAYRVRPRDAALSIAVESAGGRLPVDGIADLSAFGAALLLPPAQLPPLGTSETVRLRIHTPHADGAVAVPARVLSRSQAPEGWHYRFVFEPEDDAFETAYGRFFEVFNRRAALRGVRPASDAPVIGTICARTGGTTTLAMQVINISTGGVCAGLTPEADAALAEAQAVTLTLRLPGSGSDIVIAASVCYRAVDDSAVLYGLRFDAGATKGYLEHAEDILGYILARLEADPSGAMH